MPIIPPPAKIHPAIEIDDETKTKLSVKTEQQVIVHGSCYVESGGGIRIWPTTYLFPKGFNKRCKLLYCENIGIYPEFLYHQSDGEMKFTLIFEGLPDGCSSFDLIEVIPEPLGFESLNIIRNKADVYHLEL